MANLSAWGKVPVIGLKRLLDVASLAANDGFWTADDKVLSPVHDYLFTIISATLMADAKLDQQEHELLTSILIDPPDDIQEMQRRVTNVATMSTSEHRKAIPAFFRGIVEQDKANKSKHSVDAIMAVYATWSAFAIADGKTANIETALFNEYLHSLSEVVAAAGIASLPEIESLILAPMSIVDFVRGSTGDHVPFSLSELQELPPIVDLAL